MKILLTHGYFLEDDEKEKKIMRPYPPLGLLYIAAYLEKHQFSCEVFDTTFQKFDQLRSTLLTTKPDVIGIYTNLMTKLTVLKLIDFIRENLPATLIVLGGPDTRFNDERYLRHGAHVAVVGEGEQTMLELLQSYKNSNQDFSTVAGIAYLHRDEVVRTAERGKLKDLDELPLPARDKIDLSLYLDAWKKHHGSNAISVSTMRGCPYTCKWCSRGVYGLSYRRRSPENVVQELESIRKKYNPDTLWFVDDVFTISHKWLEAFAAELKRKEIVIPYECITRADRMNDRVIALLKQSGCFRVWIGAESGSQRVIDLMDRRVEVDQVKKMIQQTRKAGIEAGTFIMLGYPGETEVDIKQTISHLKESNPDRFTITVAYPINGTELYEEVVQASPDVAWTTSTDRQIDFKRTYNRSYYDHAVRHVINEVHGHQALDKKQNLKFVKHKIKSLLARVAMYGARI